MRILVFFFVFTCFCLPIQAGEYPQTNRQVEPSFWVELNSGFAVGWWMINNGSDNPIYQNNLSYDYSHLSSFVPVAMTAGVQTAKWRFGIGGSLTTFFETSMRKQLFDDPTKRSYNIAETSVHFFKIYLQTTYILKTTPSYSLGVYGKAGLFREDSNHPAKNNFDKQYSWSFGIDNSISVNQNVILVIRPVLENSIITLKNKTSANNMHRIFNFGIDLGMRYQFRKNNK